PNIKLFRVFGCRCYLHNDYEDVGKLKAKGDIGVFVGYLKESAAFRIYNKRTRKINESVNEETHFTKRLLYDNSSPRPPKEIVSDNSNANIESFCPYPIPNEDSDSRMEEIDLSLNPDDPMPSSIEDDDHDSKRDILILEELLDNYSLSLDDNESYHFDIPSPYRPPAKPPDGKTGTLNIKMMGDVSDQNVPIPELTIIHISNQEKSPGILSHQGLEIFKPSAECLIIINRKNTPVLDVPHFYFYPP
nr:integrase, catalytic region, zinc finger, CCHC-type, peptidase aspartic, catalytic [Tanacetum cinerariifolium]